MRHNINRIFMVFGIVALFLVFGCATTVDWRKLDSPVKRYHFAQLSFEDMQKEYIAIFPGQPEETKGYLRENVVPVLHKAKLALDAWGAVIIRGMLNIGQESRYTELFEDLALLLKPYIVKEE